MVSAQLGRVQHAALSGSVTTTLPKVNNSFFQCEKIPVLYTRPEVL